MTWDKQLNSINAVLVLETEVKLNCYSEVSADNRTVQYTRIMIYHLSGTVDVYQNFGDIY